MCLWGTAGKLLGFLVSNRGIEANREKIKAITSLAKPARVNVLRLAGHIAALSRFISRLGEKAIPLYQMMRKTDHFVWSDAANQAFEALKKQLSKSPILAAPIDKEPLLLYVAANSRAISVQLWWKGRNQARNIWFSSRFITSVRCSLSPSRGIRIGRSLYMGVHG